MEYDYSRRNLTTGERILERIFEIMPGFTSWVILIGMIVLSVTKPLVATAIMIAFLIYWVFRLVYMNIFLVISYLYLSAEKNVNWLDRLRDLDRMKGKPDLGRLKNEGRGFKKRISFNLFKSNLKKLIRAGGSLPSSEDIYHLILVPAVTETEDVIESGVLSYLEDEFPAERKLMVIALEERAEKAVKKGILNVQKKYKDKFMDFLVIMHPTELPGEARVKGANATYAARQAAEYFTKKNISYENVIVSCFDADTIVNPHYFSALTFYYLVAPERTRASFQPIPVFHNNIWKTSSFARILDVGTSFFQLIEATDSDKLITFSSHSMSFKALVDVGYWTVEMIAEDSGIFWKSFIRFDGNYRVVPIYVTLSMDIPEGRNFMQTSGRVYKQKRRWAWGVENFPVVMRAFLRCRTISLYNKIRYGYKLFERAVSWATWPFLLTFVSWLPVLFAQREFSHTVMYYNYPRIKRIVFGLALTGLLLCVFLSLLLMPKKAGKHSLAKRIRHVLEWVFLPIVSIALSGIPALDAQTRLMLGKDLAFWVTPKER